MPTATLPPKVEALLKQARDIAERAEKDGDRDFTPEEQTQVKSLLDQAKAHGETSNLKSLLGDFGPAKADVPGTGTPAETIIAKTQESLGKQFAESPEFKAWLKNIAPNGTIPDSYRFGQSPPMQFEGLKGLRAHAKALITGTSETSAGALMATSQFLGLLDQGVYARPLTIKDIITVGQTDGDTVDYAREVSVTNAAAPVAEATSAALPTQDGSTGPLVQATGGGYKPESAYVTERKTANVKTIAHWIPATKRALSDAGQLRTLIDQFLNYGLEEELEDQIMTGGGTGENFTGISATSGIQTQAKGSDSIITQVRKAKTKVRTVGRAIANAVVLNPADWEKFDLLVDNEQRYYFGGPMAMGTPRLWGLPVVESEGTPAGTGYVGDFKKCVLWDRQQATISISDSHADFFIRNLVAILAELRAAFGIVRPAAIVKLTDIA